MKAKLNLFIYMTIILLLIIKPIKISSKKIDNLSYIKFTYNICSTEKKKKIKKVNKKPKKTEKKLKSNNHIEEFLNNFYPICKQISERSNIPIEIILGQAALESSYGRSDASKNRNNYFGIRKGNKYISYNNKYDSFLHYEKILLSKRYKSLHKLSSYVSWPAELKRIGYAEDPGYANRLLMTIKTLKRYGKRYFV